LSAERGQRRGKGAALGLLERHHLGFDRGRARDDAGDGVVDGEKISH
jgi:hypothetical protein